MEKVIPTCLYPQGNIVELQNQQTMQSQSSLLNMRSDYGLENINAHAIRRAYAKNLHDNGASIALISVKR